MAKGGPAILLALVIIVLFLWIIMFILRVLGSFVFPDETLHSYGDMLWRSFIQVSSFGSIDEDLHSNYLNKTLAIISVCIGLTFRLALVALMVVKFRVRLENLRKGKSSVIEKGHTVILGFGIQTIEIIEQLIIFNKSKGGKQAIVVVSNKDKTEMDDSLSEYIKHRHNTRIITRSGDISKTKFIKEVSLNEADSIIVLNNANVADPPGVRDRGDSNVLESIIAIAATSSDSGKIPYVIAQLHSDKNRKLAENIVPGKIIIIDTNDILARILVYTSLNPGLAFVYSNLVGFQGHSLYISNPKSGWSGHSFGKLQFHFINSTLMGLLTSANNIILNPSPDFIPSDDYMGIFLAPDKDSIKFFQKQIITPKQQKYFMRKSRIVLEKQLIIGWNSKISIILDEYANSMRDGSSIDIIVESITGENQSLFKTAQNKIPNIKMRLIEGDIHSTGFLKELAPHKYDNVVILAEESQVTEEVDLKTISRVLSFRHYFHEYEIMTKTSVQTRMVTEVIDSDKSDVFFQAGVKDFLIPHKFVSEIIAQISQNIHIKSIYNALFNKRGCEIYVKPVSLYFKDFPIVSTFADCVFAAQTRQELCLGVKIGSESKTEEKNYGLYFSPDKNIMFNFSNSDSLITLAETRN